MKKAWRSMDKMGLTLDLQECRLRQRRFGESLAQRDLQFALLTRPEHVQYFTGFRPPLVLQAVVIIFPDGKTSLAAPNQVPEFCAVDDAVHFAAQWHCTLRQDQMHAALAALEPVLQRRSKTTRIAIEASVNPAAFAHLPNSTNNALIDIEPVLWKQRRCKGPDELRLIRKAIDCTAAMYQVAREIIEPGISELEVYNQLHATAVNVAGEPLTAFGNDFQCHSPGGPPRTRLAQAGELFILDLGPAYRGYYADNCRTFRVQGHPTDEQHQAWQAIVDVLKMVESTVRPGVSASQLFTNAQQILNAAIQGGCFHHLGHGIGLSPHETPHLNDHWDDAFQVGDVFTAEPGLYAPQLKAGIRLEQNYLVTEQGVECLTSFPLDL